MFRRIRQHWQQRKVESIFLIMATVFGLMFVFLIPPTQAADETTHFYRTYQLTEGKILSQPIEAGYGDYLPKEVYETSLAMFGHIPSHYERTFPYRRLPGWLRHKVSLDNPVPVHLEGSTVYSPVSYLPQMAAVQTVKTAWPSVALMYYAGRLANLITWIVLVYLALRFWPGNKWPLFALAMVPMSLSQAATMSPDAVTHSLAFLTISLIFYYAHRAVRLRWPQMLLIGSLLVLLALCKPPLCVLAILVLILKSRQFSSWRQRWIFVGGAAGLALAAMAIWNGLVVEYSDAIQHYYYPADGVDKFGQVIHALKQPWDFAYALGRTYLSSIGDVYSRSYIGRLGWGDVDLPIWMLVINYMMIILALCCRDLSGVKEKFSRVERRLSLAIFGLGFMAVNAVLYATLAPVGDDFIIGLSGRYFTPFTPLLIPVFAGLLKVQNWDKIAARLLPAGYVGILTLSLAITISRFI